MTISNSATDYADDTILGALNFYSNDTSGGTSAGGIGSIRVYTDAAFNSGASPSYMSFYTHANSTNDGTVLGNPTERMRIDSAGNVGIGTTAPSANLDVRGLDSLAAPYYGTVTFRDTTSLATNIGASLLLQGKYTSGGAYAEAALLKAYKENATDGNDAFAFGISTRPASGVPTERLRITSTGNVGIGTTGPEHPLHVSKAGSSSATTPVITLENSTQATANGSGAALMFILKAGGGARQNAGKIASVFSTYTGTGATDLVFMVEDDAEKMRLSSTGLGIAMTPSVALDVTGDIEYTGTITDVSDERLKENIQDFESGLDIINSIGVKSYNMIGSIKPETGFIAQNVLQIFPQAVSVVDPTNGYMGVSYVSFVPVLTKAIQEIAQISGAFKTALVGWLADAGNGILKLFAKEVETELLCVGDGTGARTCITKAQLDSMLAGAGAAAPQNNADQTQNDAEGSSASETEPPVEEDTTNQSSGEDVMGQTATSTEETITEESTAQSDEPLEEPVADAESSQLSDSAEATTDTSDEPSAGEAGEPMEEPVEETPTEEIPVEPQPTEGE